jgi:hypothetical protein
MEQFRSFRQSAESLATDVTPKMEGD